MSLDTIYLVQSIQACIINHSNKFNNMANPILNVTKSWVPHSFRLPNHFADKILVNPRVVG